MKSRRDAVPGVQGRPPAGQGKVKTPAYESDTWGTRERENSGRRIARRKRRAERPIVCKKENANDKRSKSKGAASRALQS